MGVLIALAGLALFAAGATVGVIGLLSVAIRREERNLTLTGEAPDITTRAARCLNGVHVRAPRPAADEEPALLPDVPQRPAISSAAILA